MGWYDNSNDKERAKVLAFLNGYLQATAEREPTNSKDLKSKYEVPFALKLLNMMKDFSEELRKDRHTQAIPVAHAYCDDCDYETKAMPMMNLIYEVSNYGGYIRSDKDGGYFSQCPECQGKNLTIIPD